MKRLSILFLLFLLIQAIPTKSQDQQVVPYSLADRDRMIRNESKLEVLETKIDALDAKFTAKFDGVNDRFESLEKRFDFLSTLFFWGFGILVTLFIFNLGYTIWDRRTAMKPALENSVSAIEKSTGLVYALRDYAQKHPDLATILKTYGLL